MTYKCRLRVILAEMDVRHGEFADRIGVKQATMSAIINNRSLPSFDTAYIILKELGLNIDDVWVKTEDES